MFVKRDPRPAGGVIRRATEYVLCQNSYVAQKTFKYRLQPTPAQERAMVQTLRECRGLYNHLLSERRDTFKQTGNGISLYSQINRLKELKQSNSALREVHSQILQNVAVRIDLAFKAFFRRVQAKEEPGYPRFRGPNRYDSFTYPQSGFRVEDKRVFLSKIGHVKAVIHRPLEGTVKTATVRKTATDKWFVCLSCEVEIELLPESTETVGVDVGLTDIIATSDGESVPAPKFFRKVKRKNLHERNADSPKLRRVLRSGRSGAGWWRRSTSASRTNAAISPIRSPGSS